MKSFVIGNFLFLISLPTKKNRGKNEKVDKKRRKEREKTREIRVNKNDYYAILIIYTHNISCILKLKEMRTEQ